MRHGRTAMGERLRQPPRRSPAERRVPRGVSEGGSPMPSSAMSFLPTVGGRSECSGASPGSSQGFHRLSLRKASNKRPSASISGTILGQAASRATIFRHGCISARRSLSGRRRFGLPNPAFAAARWAGQRIELFAKALFPHERPETSAAAVGADDGLLGHFSLLSNRAPKWLPPRQRSPSRLEASTHPFGGGRNPGHTLPSAASSPLIGVAVPEAFGARGEHERKTELTRRCHGGGKRSVASPMSNSGL